MSAKAGAESKSKSKAKAKSKTKAKQKQSKSKEKETEKQRAPYWRSQLGRRGNTQPKKVTRSSASASALSHLVVGQLHARA